jgi:hypothetical protein
MLYPTVSPTPLGSGLASRFSRLALGALCAASFVALAACGGGTDKKEEEGCGGKTILAGISYNGANKTATVGVPVEFRSFVTPATCEGQMVFGIRSGSLPPGMQLNGIGNVLGTPTTAGNYSATVVILRVNGYNKWLAGLEPSATLNISVAAR